MKHASMGILLLCSGAVLLQGLFYVSMIASQDRLGAEIAAGLDKRDGSFIERADHSQHTHGDGGEGKSFGEIQGIVERLAEQVEREEAEEQAFQDKLQSIIKGESLASVAQAREARPTPEPAPIVQRPGRVSCEPERPTTVFYNRIGKAGSTTLNEWIKKQTRESGAAVVFGTDPESLDQSPLREEREIERAVRARGPTVYISHIYYLDFEKFDYHPSLSYINMMRHPGERYISQYYFWRNLKDQFGQECRERGITLEECIDLSHDDVVYTCPMANYQTLYFCGHGPDCVAPATEATFQLAKKHLVEEYSTVGVVEEIERYAEVLLRKFPDFFQSPEIDTGHSMKTVKKTPPDERILAKATELNNYDAMLYEVALDLFHQQATNCGL